MSNVIPSVFTKELKNSFDYMRTSLKLLNEREVGIEKKQKIIENYISTTKNSIFVVNDYLEFMKSKSKNSFKISTVDIYKVLNSVKDELKSILKEKNINIYIEKNSFNIEIDEFWFKKAIYYLFLDIINYKKSGNINIYTETRFNGVYLSISTIGKEARKKRLKTIFRSFEEINENSYNLGVELGVAKYILENLNNSIIKTKSNKILSSEFILYLPKKMPKDIIKKSVISILTLSLFVFLTLSYFPIYPQHYTKKESSEYEIYNFEDGSIVMFKKNSNYKISSYKNLYKTEYLINTSIKKGEIYLKTLKNRVVLNVENRKFKTIKNSEFEVFKNDKSYKLAIFNGIVKSEKASFEKGIGAIFFKKEFVKVRLLNAIKDIKFYNSNLILKNNAKFVKYQIIVSDNKDFSDIVDSFYTTDNHIKLNVKDDTLYFIKIFGFSKNRFPSMPKIVKYMNLSHYYKALELINKNNLKKALSELKLSVETINNNSSIPYFEIAKLYFLEKNYNKSIKYISKALKIDKKLDYYLLLFSNCDKINKIKELQNKINYLFNKYPNNIDLLYFKSVSLYKNGNYKKAQKYLFKLLELKPYYKNANYLMSEILAKQRYKKMADYYKKMEK